MRRVIVLGFGLLVIAAAVAGPSQMLADLAEFGGQFAHDENGRFDAAVLLASCIAVIPFAALAVLLVGIPVTVLVLETAVFPVTRAVGISDGVAAFVAISTTLVLVLATTDIPIWSIQGLGTVARAWIVVTT